jgi:hypothetical protein
MLFILAARWSDDVRNAIEPGPPAGRIKLVSRSSPQAKRVETKPAAPVNILASWKKSADPQKRGPGRATGNRDHSCECFVRARTALLNF